LVKIHWGLEAGEPRAGLADAVDRLWTALTVTGRNATVIVARHPHAGALAFSYRYLPSGSGVR
jgi:hypothetical protein